MTKEILGNERIWRSLSGDQLEEYIDNVFKYYRNDRGFPYYPTDPEYRKKEFQKFIRYDKEIISDGVIRQTMHGLALAWSYFPHSFNVQCNNLLTPLEVFNDDDKFRQVIVKRTKYGTYMNDSGIRKMLKMYSGTQAVSNFRPTAACAIYNRYGNSGTVWDMSAGWGGRLLGAIKSDVQKYIGTEPSSLTFVGLNDLANDFSGDTEVELYKLGSETYKPLYNSLDLCFTSPPYFDLEKYSDESTQSYIAYPTLNEWLNKFWKVTVQNCHYGLKPTGYMLVNIADTKRKNLSHFVKDICMEVGFEHVDTLKLALSNPKFGGQGFKYEPVYVFTVIK